MAFMTPFDKIVLIGSNPSSSAFKSQVFCLAIFISSRRELPCKLAPPKISTGAFFNARSSPSLLIKNLTNY